MSEVLHLAEIPHESGAIRFRYARVMSADGTRWIRHGLFVEYSETGAVVAEGSYADGSEDGLWRAFHPNGNLAAEGCYRDGREVGVWRFWSADGSSEPDVVHESDGAHG
jgi:antitoxin component YwqK of YwqJK toxin-antitoxin module